MKNSYSTRELADMLSVNESTVKRWADSGFIECVKTKGGHRKFPVRSVLKFVHENRMNVPSLSLSEFDQKDVQAHLSAGFVDVLVPTLKQVALQGDSYEIQRIMRTAFVSQPDLITLYTKLVFPSLVEIGAGWENGELGVDSEHLATQAIKSALFRFQSEIFVKEPNGLSAIVSCFEGEVHDIAITCVASYLTSEGWRIYHLGQDIPTEDLVTFIKIKKPDLVALSADIVENERSFVFNVNNKIVPAAKNVGGMTILGGSGVPARFGGRVKCDLLSEDITDMKEVHERILNKRTAAPK
jgi:excisionase family DNA binding protein